MLVRTCCTFETFVYILSQKIVEEKHKMSSIPYATGVGSLMSWSCICRSIMVSRYMYNPENEHAKVI